MKTLYTLLLGALISASAFADGFVCQGSDKNSQTVIRTTGLNYFEPSDAKLYISDQSCDFNYRDAQSDVTCVPGKYVIRMKGGIGQVFAIPVDVRNPIGTLKCRRFNSPVELRWWGKTL